MNFTKNRMMAMAGWMMMMCVAMMMLLFCGGCAKFDETLYNKREIPGAVVGTNAVTITNLVTKTNFVVAVGNERIGTADEREARAVAAARPGAEVRQEIRTVEEVVTKYEHIYGPKQIVLEDNPAVKNSIGFLNFIPGWGQVSALAAGWIYAVYRNIRNRRFSAAIVESVQAGREFLQGTPQGKQLDAEFKQVLVESQLASGVIQEVRHLLDNYVVDHTQPLETEPPIVDHAPEPNPPHETRTA